MRTLEFDVLTERGEYVRTLRWEQRPDRPIDVGHLRLLVEDGCPGLAGTDWRMAFGPGMLKDKLKTKKMKER